MLTTTCTVCGIPLVGHPDDDACCEACTTINFPPPEDIPLPWWQAVRLRLAPNREGIRAMAHLTDDEYARYLRQGADPRREEPQDD